MNLNKMVLNRKQIIIAVVGILGLYWIVTHSLNKKPTPIPPPPVVVEKPSIKKIVEYITQTGNVVAYNSVNIVARVEGYLESIEFIDGSFVPKGKELFVIQPEPYFDLLKEAQASVFAQKASYEYDKIEYERQKIMYKQKATSLNNVQKWYAKQIRSKALIIQTEANERNAQITYDYTHVRAPYNGRIGRHLVDVANLVGHGEATNLATIEQIDQIYVYFNLNELDLIKLREVSHKHGINPSDLSDIPVFVAMQNETGFTHEGRLNFVNTGLNASTGTMEFRALLQNKDYSLLPGMFVTVRVPVSLPKDQLTIPNEAVQYDQIGPYVYTVDKNNLVHINRVTLGVLEQNIRAITKGIKAEDSVIVAGIQNAIEGHPVSLSGKIVT
jgi:RND family efflux transporter MFP subunit